MSWLNLSTATRIANFGRSRPAWQRFLGAALLTALVVMGRMALNEAWGRQQNRHLLFLPTVMLMSWLWGFLPGLVSAVMTTTAMALWWSNPSLAFDLPHVELALYFLVAGALAGLVESLHVARARADQASKAHEQVLAIVAHDLRNPLTTIRMTLDRMRRGPPDESSDPRRIGTIDRATLRMERLIRDLVDSTRIEQGGLTLNVREEPPDPIVRDAVELLAPLAQERSISVEIAGSAPDALIYGDRGRVQQVLENLLGNALKFTPEGGHVTVSVTAEADAVQFRVDDTGPGIEPKHLPHLFERYWKTDPKGTGLGLFIANSIVLAHGGSMGVRSQPGSGASFFFVVPRKR